MEIKISEGIKAKLPDMLLGVVEIEVETGNTTDELKSMIKDRVEEMEKELTPEKIREMPAVKANKDAYRRLGKDPNRYRPSSESLLRRVANGKGLYFINNVVDVLNLISVNTGYSICGYDADKIKGEIVLGTGEADEPYEGIGRGTLNIENLPVFRDEEGAFGTPTSDSVRTMVTENTKHFLMIIIAFGNREKLEEEMEETVKLYRKYAGGKNEKLSIIN